MVGNEGHRLNKVYQGQLGSRVHKCVLPPYPRKMGTYVPETLVERAFELEALTFTDKFQDSHFALAIQTALELGVTEIQLVGFDGYSEGASHKELELSKENEYLMSKIQSLKLSFLSITPTLYDINSTSVYSYLG